MRRTPVPKGQFDTKVPFTRAAGFAHGLTDKDLEGPGFHRVLWGVHVHSSVRVDLCLRIRAALLVVPDAAIVSHHTACVLWGGVPPDSPDVHVSVPKMCRPKVVGVQPHRLTVMPVPVQHRGFRVTDPERTFLDMGKWSDLVQLVVLGDSMVRAKSTTPEKLVAAAAAWPGPWKSLLVRAAGLVRRGVDSPMETRLRLLLVLAGFQEPTVNLEVSDIDGRLVYRIDLGVRGAKVAIEYDGRHHIERKDQWERDLLRREDLEADGWTFVVVTSSHIYSSPEKVLDRCAAALRAHGAWAPSKYRSEWRRFFLPREVA